MEAKMHVIDLTEEEEEAKTNVSSSSSELDLINEELHVIEQEMEQLLLRQSELEYRKQTLLKLNKKPRTVSLQPDWSHSTFEWSKEAKQILTQTFGLSSFRDKQEAVLNCTMSKQDAFLIMRSGGGKSLCYQLASLLEKANGFTVVVSPLLSLISDQVMLFNEIVGSGSALELSSRISRQDTSLIYKEILQQDSRMLLLFVTPEKVIKSKLLMSRLEKAYKMKALQRFVIDEAHCCSQWGHDFRQDYAKLGLLKRQFPDTPILALTATASSRVIKDVKSILEINNCNFFHTTFNRINLVYEVRRKLNNDSRTILDIANYIKENHSKSSGIIYCFSRKETENVAALLCKNGIKARYYHAYMEDRDAVHQSWCRNKIQVVVATVAFGLGINKPDVRFVIHFTLSKSLEGYYQETGRAGRDGLIANCILYYKAGDISKISSMVHHEQGGLASFHLMMNYAENNRKCRKQVMADYFGELFTPSTMCSNMCDNCCSNENNIEEIDVTKHSIFILKVLLQNLSKDKRFTMKQLLDEIKMKKYSSLIEDLKPSLKPMDLHILESVVAQLILRNYLKEEFSYTAYSTICYYVPGVLYNQLLKGEAQIVLAVKNERINLKKTNQNQALERDAEGSLHELLVVAINEIASEKNIYPHTILSQKHINSLVQIQPNSEEALATVIGDSKCKKYKDILLPILSESHKSAMKRPKLS